jgi:hypothetical protein
MATWIVHLRIAEKLLEQIPGLDAGQFAIGNVAPDSGIPDENWENFDPPTSISHFHSEQNSDEKALEDLRFYRHYLAEVSFEDQPVRFSFLLGYFFHLVTDNLWWLDIFIPTEDKYKPEFDADPKFIWEVKKDWYGLDFSHVRAHPESIFWQIFLPAECTTHYLDFYLPEAIPRQLTYIKTFYQRQDEEVEKKLRLTRNIYLTSSEMDDFVDRASQTLLSIYDLIYNQEIPLGEYTTALELIGYYHAD